MSGFRCGFATSKQGRNATMFDRFTVEVLAQERQREIQAAIARSRQAEMVQAGGSRRAVAAVLAAVARWLDPAATGRVVEPMPLRFP
jgi:predicted transcriptional regulator